MIYSGHYLRQSVLIFFDDILVYNKTLDDQVHQLYLVLQTLDQHTLYVKKSKCSFVDRKVEYLGYIINKEGVSIDPKKIEVVQSWPKPQTIKQLRGVLGLTRYYRLFAKGYGIISKPLTDLLKTDSFTCQNKLR